MEDFAAGEERKGVAHVAWITDSALLELEETIQKALITGDESRLTILGYGEISLVLRADTAEGTFACKRLPVFREQRDAEHHMALIREYIQVLEDTGMEVQPTDVRRIEHADGRSVVFCVQHALDPATLGTAVFGRLPEEEAVEAYRRIVDRIEASVSTTLAPDGQLSNWAFVGDSLLYMDVTTPLMNDANGKSRVNWTPLVKSLPAPVRPYIRRRIPYIIGFYHSFRGQMLDFLANLRKEKLDHLYPALMPYTQERYGFDPPITMDDLRVYYAENAQGYVLLERVKRIDRWVQRHLLCRTYPNLLAPTIERNLFEPVPQETKHG